MQPTRTPPSPNPSVVSGKASSGLAGGGCLPESSSQTRGTDKTRDGDKIAGRSHPPFPEPIQFCGVSPPPSESLTVPSPLPAVDPIRVRQRPEMRELGRVIRHVPAYQHLLGSSPLVNPPNPSIIKPLPHPPPTAHPLPSPSPSPPFIPLPLTSLFSACSCPDSDHPGPSHNIGRGAPEIDIFEASKDKQNAIGGTVSQSAQFAPFAHDYMYYNDTEDKWKNFDPERTRANSFLGSAVQQSVSGVTRVPSDMFQGSGQRFTSFGFEYHGHPKSRDQGYVQWQVDGRPTHRVGAGAVAADPEVQIGNRLIPEEPMAIILNLGMSPNWQTIDLATMTFPGEMLIDYVRVYQRKDEINVGCDPTDYPTKKYIDDHLEAYTVAVAEERALGRRMLIYRFPLLYCYDLLDAFLLALSISSQSLRPPHLPNTHRPYLIP
ncbi:hypothetical protein NMY22_g20074 [Coprinellus aureogranulatus]|nr:hypothetical protein NMY22_g20074 [Coprinellus aureogranulatus]